MNMMLLQLIIFLSSKVDWIPYVLQERFLKKPHRDDSPQYKFYKIYYSLGGMYE